MTEAESVHCEVQTGSLKKTDTVSSLIGLTDRYFLKDANFVLGQIRILCLYSFV